MGHHKKFQYYFSELILPVEPYLVAGAACLIAGALVVLAKSGPSKLFGRGYDSGRFLFTWTLSSFVVYSLIPYKTPWLVINISLPAALSLAWALCNFFPRILTFALAAVVVGWGLWFTAIYNFRTVPFMPGGIEIESSAPFGGRNPYSYVHTAEGMLELVSDIRSYLKKNPEGRVLVGCDQYWPLPYYLRELSGQVGYEKVRSPEPQLSRYDILVLNKQLIFNRPGWLRKYLRISDVQEVQVYFRVR